MNRFVLYFLCAPLVATLLTTPAQADQTITWVTPDTRPFNIVEGKDKGTGYSDQLRAFFMERLTGYAHDTKVMTISRYLLSARQGKTLCMCDLLKNPEREEILQYSDPVVLTPGLRVYVKPGGAISFGEDYIVDMEQLLSDPQLRTVFMQQRSYGPELDRLIEQFGDRQNVRITQISPVQITRLLLEARIDYLVEYPYAMPATMQTLGSNLELVPLKIRGQADHAVAYLTCSDTVDGRAMVKAVNQILRANKNSAEYRKIFMLPAKGMGHYVQEDYDELWNIFQTMN